MYIVTSPPEGVARYCFHPVCLSVCLCLCVCPADILVFYFSAIRRDIDLKFIQDSYRVVLNSLKKGSKPLGRIQGGGSRGPRTPPGPQRGGPGPLFQNEENSIYYLLFNFLTGHNTVVQVQVQVQVYLPIKKAKFQRNLCARYN